MRIGRSVCAVLTLAAVLAPGWVRGREGTSFRMVNPRFVGFPPTPVLTGPVGRTFRPGVSVGSVLRQNNCRLRVRLKYLFSLPVSDGQRGTGDEVICLVHAWMDLEGPNFGTIVMRGELRPEQGGRTSVEAVALLDEETALCTPVGTADHGRDVYYETRVTHCYEPDPSYDPPLTVPFASDPTQGLVLGAYAPRPTSPLIATEGLFFGSPGGAFLDPDLGDLVGPAR